MTLNEEQKRKLRVEVMRLKETGLSERKIAEMHKVSATFIHRLIRPKDSPPPRPKGGGGRFWLQDVRTVGVDLKRKLDALWPPTPIFEDEEEK